MIQEVEPSGVMRTFSLCRTHNPVSVRQVELAFLPAREAINLSPVQAALVQIARGKLQPALQQNQAAWPVFNANPPVFAATTWHLRYRV